MNESTDYEAISNQTLDVITRLNRWAQSAIRQDQIKGELSLRQLSALHVIEHEEMTPGQLARRLMVTPAVVTGLIDRLERRGYVRRASESGDRRRIQLELTEAGREASTAVRADLAELYTCALSGLSDTERIALSDGLAILDRVIADLETRGFASQAER